MLYHFLYKKNISTLVSSPTNFLVDPYAFGYTIDFQQRGSITDLEKFRQAFNFEAFNTTCSDAEFATRAGRAVVQLGIAEDENDFSASLHAYTDHKQAVRQIVVAGFGEPRHETARLHSTETTLSGLAAGCGTGQAMGV